MKIKIILIHISNSKKFFTSKKTILFLILIKNKKGLLNVSIMNINRKF